MTVPAFACAWPWLGALAAAVLAFLLVATRALRATAAGPRWRDPAWLAWLATLVYLVHNVEEYGVDALGQAYAFPAALDALVAGRGGALPNAFFIAVNVSLVWVALPLAALGAKRCPRLALAGPGVMAVNLVTHVVGAFRVGYNPGLATALLLFVPMVAWTFGVLPHTGRVAVRDLPRAVVAGALLHAVLMASALAYVHGVLDEPALVAIQIANPALLLAILGWPLLASARGRS